MTTSPAGPAYLFMSSMLSLLSDVMVSLSPSSMLFEQSLDQRTRSIIWSAFETTLPATMSSTKAAQARAQLKYARQGGSRAKQWKVSCFETSHRMYRINN
jgi:hypothetical protein